MISSFSFLVVVLRTILNDESLFLLCIARIVQIIELYKLFRRMTANGC